MDVDSAATAGRECSEETLGLFGGCACTQRGVGAAAEALAARLRCPGLALKVPCCAANLRVQMLLCVSKLRFPARRRHVDYHRCSRRCSLAGCCLTVAASLLQVTHDLRVGQYIQFITQLPYVSPLMFRLATQQNGATRAVAGAEKSAFAW